MAGPAQHIARGPPSEGSEKTVTDTPERTLRTTSADTNAPAVGPTPSTIEQSVARTTDSARPAKRRGGSISSMLLPELQELAASLGIATTKMRKSELVAAIQQARAGTTTDAQPTLGGDSADGKASAADTKAAPRRERRSAS